MFDSGFGGLTVARAVIDLLPFEDLVYLGDTGRYPDTLDQLVEKKYLRAPPLDPITDSSTSWIIVPPEDGAKGGVYNIKSGAPGNDRSGRPYADW